VLSPEVLEQVGVAAVSGQAPFSSMARRENGKDRHLATFKQDLEMTSWCPTPSFVDGQVIQVFDEITHARSAEMGSGGRERIAGGCGAAGRCDGRGELTLDMLDLAYKPTLKYFEAPLQLKANNGVLLWTTLAQPLIPRSC